MTNDELKTLAHVAADLFIQTDVEGVITNAIGDARLLRTIDANQLLLANVFQILDVPDIGAIRRGAASLTAGERASFDDPLFGDHGRRISIRREQSPTEGLAFSFTRLENHTVLSRDRVEEHHLRAFRAAVADRDLKAALQPIVDTRTGRVSHYEVLCRFPFEGSPAPFIAAAERAGMISQLDSLMVDAAANMLSRHDEGLQLSVNISGDTIQRVELIDLLIRIINQYSFDARRLILELTESSEIQDVPTASNSVDRLRETGAKIVLDDFGAGAASFGYLRSLNVDGVKFDGCFLASGGNNSRNNALLRSIASMCAELGMSAVGERVETEDDRRILMEAGVGLAQGWFFGRPEISESFFEFDRSAAAYAAVC